MIKQSVSGKRVAWGWAMWALPPGGAKDNLQSPDESKSGGKGQPGITKNWKKVRENRRNENSGKYFLASTTDKYMYDNGVPGWCNVF